VSTVVKGIQLTIGDILWLKNNKKSGIKKLWRGNQLKLPSQKVKLFSKKKNPTNVNTNTVTYASVAASGLHYQ
jgi:hypothetical protein